MIKIADSVRRSFLFPADLPMAYAYYGDVGRLLSYLPHICLVRVYGPARFRLLYNTTELGTYHVRIFADVEASLDEEWLLRVRPLDGVTPVGNKAGFHSSTTQGYFSSQSVFYNKGHQTRIEYNLQLRAALPTPLGLRLMPSAMVSRVAGSITRMRIREIAEGFIERSVAAFPHWLAELGNHSVLTRQPGPRTMPQPDPDYLQNLDQEL